jgi:hypothetical protein
MGEDLVGKATAAMEHGPHVLAEQQPFGGGLGLLGDVKK